MLDTSLYVDDLIFSSDSVDKAFSLSAEAVTILKEAGMRLRKFETNSTELKERWQNYDVSLVTQGKSEKPLKVLGINWNTSEDLFGLDIQSLLLTLESYKNTKRNVLQVAAKCYDPAGFVSPFIIRVKCLLQEIWKLGLSWDENFEGETLKKWNEWCSEVQFLKQFSVPRYYFGCSNKVIHESIQLHVFSDASLHAYGAVAYFRYNDEQHGIKTSFVLSKSRVAPVKKLTLPRLELMGALIASRIGNYLKNLFSIQNIIYWTDSTITLFWIKGCATKWKQFVSNRVAEIQELTNPQNWRHCDGKSNPADLVSRGCSASELISNKIWLEGPVWLSKLENQWPKLKVKENNFDDLAEERNIKKTALVNVMNIEDRVFGVLTKISSWTKLQRIVAWCLRFIANSKLASNWKKGCLTVDEIRRASDVILKKIQRNEFAEEIKCLEVGKPVSSHSRLISLNPFLDKNNVMRVGGRLNNAEISETSKHPIIMPKKNFVTNLIIQYYHLKHLHGGVQLLLSAIRQEYWIISAKTEIKKCIWKCVKCCRFRGTTATQLMGDLPSTRVVPSKVFSKTGVDFTGPFLVKMKRGRGIRPNKCYVCLFVCFATKACHLELVGDLSSEAFIAALQRFAARRGKPQLIYSDCGTNFVGANKIIRNAIASLKSNPQFCNWISSEGIEWNFNSPAAPHHGGLWEAGVKSMKHHLRRSVGAQILTYEEFLTLIIQVEACLNSRPITPVSSDPGDLNALTPGHFLTGGPLTAVPEHDLTEQKVTPRERWKLTQQMSQSFWKRWSREYLCELQQRHKWRYSNQNIRINDLVILKEDNQPPRYWKLARVTKLYPGTDSRVRVVKLKTVNGELKCPVTKLCILPIDD